MLKITGYIRKAGGSSSEVLGVFWFLYLNNTVGGAILKTKVLSFQGLGVYAGLLQRIRLHFTIFQETARTIGSRLPSSSSAQRSRAGPCEIPLLEKVWPRPPMLMVSASPLCPTMAVCIWYLKAGIHRQTLTGEIFVTADDLKMTCAENRGKPKQLSHIRWRVLHFRNVPHTGAWL